MMKKILAAAIVFLAAGPVMAQEWTLSTVLGDMNIEALAVAPNGTAWAGQSNSIYRFDGAGWSVVTTVTGWTDVEFFGAVAPANDRAYFSGWGIVPAGGSKSATHASIYLPIVLRQSGGAGKSLSWWDVGFQEAPWDSSAHLWATGNASSGYDVWAAVWGGIYKSSDDGANWASLSDPGVGGFHSISGSGPSDIWATGLDSVRYNPCLYHYDGANWTLHTSTFSGSWPAVSVPPAGTPWYAFGSPGGTEVGQFDGSWGSLTTIPDHYPNSITSNPQTSEVWLGTENMSTYTGSIFYSSDGLNWWEQASLSAPVYSVDASCPGVVWAATTGAVYSRGQPIPPRKSPRGDYTGDGSTDVSIFRSGTGLWAVRGYTRAYFGGSSDTIVPGDYRGDGSADIAIFRPSTGLWAVRGVTRAYFGGSSDVPVPGDYRGDGSADAAIFRPNTGLWAVRGVTRAYFGGSSDIPVSADYRGDGSSDAAIFRSSTGLWAVQGVTRVYFGGSADIPVPGDYSGDGSCDVAIFRKSTGLWAVKGVTRAYFGSSSDYPVTGDYSGDGSESPAIFRSSSGLWAIRGVTRAYFGGSSDIPAVNCPWWTE